MNNLFLCKRFICYLIFVCLYFEPVLGRQSNKCQNYPYPDGVFIKNKFANNKQFIFTSTTLFKTKNIKRINLIRKTSNHKAIYSLNKFIDRTNSRKSNELNGLYQIESCFSLDGIYKVSYANRKDSLKQLNIIQKIKFYLN